MSGTKRFDFTAAVAVDAVAVRWQAGKGGFQFALTQLQAFAGGVGDGISDVPCWWVVDQPWFQRSNSVGTVAERRTSLVGLR